MSGAAVAFAKVLSEQRPAPSTPTKTTTTMNGISPGSKAQLNGQYISQLKELQNLRENGVLNEEEFSEQKKYTLENLRAVNTVRI